jgi:hypothetical protein
LPPTTIGAADFFARFTPAEQLAVQAAATANTQIGIGLTLGPAVSYANISYSNGSSVAVNAASTSHVRNGYLVTALGSSYCLTDLLLSADL